MRLIQGLYEEVITRRRAEELARVDASRYHVIEEVLKGDAASVHLTRHVLEAVLWGMRELAKEPLAQVALANAVLNVVQHHTKDQSVEDLALDEEHLRLLHAIINLQNITLSHAETYAKDIRPMDGLTQSVLFTGGSAERSLHSELRREIRSADAVWWMVSFVKYAGLMLFKKELEELTSTPRNDGQPRLRVITSTYMGASDAKAVEFLAGLPNTEVYVSYNRLRESLHAKAYLFLRDTGFDTGYIGSANLSHKAMTSGVEWTVKVTTKDIPHILDTFRKTFETYVRHPDLQRFNLQEDRATLREALHVGSGMERAEALSYFALKPYPFQQEILDRLDVERTVHGRFRNLVVAATGTGKTLISAFDFKRFQTAHPNARLLFVAHRKEILEQARKSFREVLREANFGELWVDGQEPSRRDALFASVQTLNSRFDEIARLPADHFDYVVIDEAHHSTAESYRKVLGYVAPKILLGLTATPERMDGGNILDDFDQHIAAEIRLPEAIQRGLLVPFHYFAVTDSVDLSGVSWRNGRYEVGELTRLYTESDRRVGEILTKCHDYLTDPKGVRALGFCVSKDHARFMGQKFLQQGFRAAVLTGDDTTEHRTNVRRALLKGDINYLFVVDIYNEGVDLPEVDTLLFLRPTESLTVFLQQFGRGLRLSEGKENVTVLDFVGNARAEYDFTHTFRALVGRTRQSIDKEIEQDFPHLPLGCSIVLEEKAREVILRNIKQAVRVNRARLVQRIRNFSMHSTQTLSPRHFLDHHVMEPRQLYRASGQLYGWSGLLHEAGVGPKVEKGMEHAVIKFIARKVLATESVSYLGFVYAVMQAGGDLRKVQGWHQKASSAEPGSVVGLDLDARMPVLLRRWGLGEMHPAEILQLALMLHYDVWQETGPLAGFDSIEASLLALAASDVLRREMADLVELQMERLALPERPLDAPFPCALRVHGRYVREQILVALGLSTWTSKSSNREGVALSPDRAVEALFVTLHKTDEHFAASTQYADYALSPTRFHWESQNRTRPESKQGQGYIHHEREGKQVWLFVREQPETAEGDALGFVFLGPVRYVSHRGSRPMQVEWALDVPIPSFLLHASQKLAAG